MSSPHAAASRRYAAPRPADLRRVLPASATVRHRRWPSPSPSGGRTTTKCKRPRPGTGSTCSPRPRQIAGLLAGKNGTSLPSSAANSASCCARPTEVPDGVGRQQRRGRVARSAAQARPPTGMRLTRSRLQAGIDAGAAARTAATARVARFFSSARAIRRARIAPAPGCAQRQVK